MKVVLMESLGITQEELESYIKPFQDRGIEFEVFSRTTDQAVLIEEARNADAMILANMPMPGAVIEACESLKFIDVAFTGVDHVGLEAAKAKNIAVSNASGYSTQAVAELTLGMALSLLRNMREVEARCREGKNKDGLVGYEIQGKTVGIVGFGKIGRRSGELFHAFGARILANSHHEIQNLPDYVAQVELDELLEKSDLVVLHCPLTSETRGLIHAGNLTRMKKNAILINAARGPVVKSQDLADALKNGTIAAAGIDVFDQEPPLSLEDPLLNCPHTLVTPHVAFATKESMTLRAQIVFDNLQAWMDGKQKNVIL